MATRDKVRTVAVDCPECDEKIILKNRVIWGQRLRCPHCDASLEVVETDPIELDWADDEPDFNYDDEDDW